MYVGRDAALGGCESEHWLGSRYAEGSTQAEELVARMTSPESPRSLGPLETKVMRVLWARPSQYVPVREVLQRLGEELAYTTVMTVMARLYDKGLLRRQREGRAWSYRPSSSREAYAASTMAQALRTADNRTAALLHFVADLDPAEAAALRRLLDASEPS